MSTLVANSQQKGTDITMLDVIKSGIEGGDERYNNIITVNDKGNLSVDTDKY